MATKAKKKKVKDIKMSGKKAIKVRGGQTGKGAIDICKTKP